MFDRWYVDSFQDDYVARYGHRDAQQARADVYALIAVLGWTAPADVLDVCCGAGRHARVLCDLGFSVTGLDLSLPLLDRARALVPEAEFVHGDMRDMAFPKKYDYVLNAFTSFGYFADSSDDVRVLRCIAAALRIGGTCVIDFLHVAHVRRTLIPHSVRMIGSVRCEEFRDIDAQWVTKRTDMHAPDGTVQTRYERVRLYTRAHFDSLCAEAGLVVRDVFGNYAGAPYDAEASERMIVVIGHA